VEEPSLTWRKASYSSANGGACVEVASNEPARTVMVRDTQDRDGFTLQVPAAAWSRFTNTIK
jgi:hypothetical protein